MSFMTAEIERINGSILVTLITGMVTVVGWFATKGLERRQKRIEFRRAYIQRQIEEFYGPLYSLLWQLFSSNSLQQRMTTQCSFSEDEKNRVQQYFFEAHFLPLHARIKSILDSKLYLVDGTDMPRSFYDYLTHSLQEDTQRQLWINQGISTVAVRGTSFPPEFYETVEETLKKLMREYEISVQELKIGFWGKNRSQKEKDRAEKEVMRDIERHAA